MTKDLTYDNTVKYGLALEQGHKKVEVIRNKGQSREQVSVAALADMLDKLDVPD